MMDLKDLQYFLFGSQAGTITGAAAKLCMAQPPLSRQMKELEEAADISDYVKEGPYSQQALHETIQLYIDEIENTVMKQLVCGILKDHEKDFFEYPAATRNHHDFYAGLATHVLGMLQLAEQLCHLYPMLDRDLLYSGVILHDVGKTVELSGAIVSEYTTQGKLLGFPLCRLRYWPKQSSWGWRIVRKPCCFAI